MKNSINSRNKGKVGEREFAALLREHGFDARRGQQYEGGSDSPDIVSDALAWLHIEVKRVQNLNLAAACTQAKRDAGGKPWIVAHRRNHAPWMITMDDLELYRLLRRVAPFLDLQPFIRPRCITMDAELFFQFLRGTLPVLANRQGADARTSQRDVPTQTISEVSGESPDTARETRALPENNKTEQPKQQQQNV